MKPQEQHTPAPSRRQQRSLPRARNFFDTVMLQKRRRYQGVAALLLACAGASVLML